MTVTGRDELFKQISFIGYYFHWTEEAILRLPHVARRRYCGEISRINRKENGGGNPFEV